MERLEESFVRIIALGHKAQQGKTWGAAYLASQLPGRTFIWGFADGIKAVARATEGMGLRKDAPLLQKVGAAYRKDDSDIWLHVWRGAVEDQFGLENVIVPDLRHRNEARYLREQMGATLIKLIRFHRGTEKVWVAQDRPADHPSETELDNWDEWDHVIKADTTASLGVGLHEQVLTGLATRLQPGSTRLGSPERP
jgi:hypothetical protein